MRNLFSVLLGSTRRKITSLTVFLLMLGTTTALAAWLVSASVPAGGGVAGVGTLTAPSLLASAPYAGSTPLFPGGTGDLQLKVHNNSTSTIKLTGLNVPALSAGASFASGINLTCGNYVTYNVATTDAAGGISTAGGTITLGTPISIAGSATVTVNVPAAVAMSNNDPSTCQGDTGIATLGGVGVTATFSN
jgi:hypothetical protein